jgi:hypothetical protein
MGVTIGDSFSTGPLGSPLWADSPPLCLSFDRVHPWNGFARLGLAQPNLVARNSQRKQPAYQSVMNLGNARCE